MLTNMFLELNSFVGVILIFFNNNQYTIMAYNWQTDVYPGLSDQFLDNGFTLDSHIWVKIQNAHSSS